MSNVTVNQIRRNYKSCTDIFKISSISSHLFSRKNFDIILSKNETLKVKRHLWPKMHSPMLTCKYIEEGSKSVYRALV